MAERDQTNFLMNLKYLPRLDDISAMMFNLDDRTVRKMQRYLFFADLWLLRQTVRRQNYLKVYFFMLARSQSVKFSKFILWMTNRWKSTGSAYKKQGFAQSMGKGVQAYYMDFQDELNDFCHWYDYTFYSKWETLLLNSLPPREFRKSRWLWYRKLRFQLTAYVLPYINLKVSILILNLIDRVISEMKWIRRRIAIIRLWVFVRWLDGYEVLYQEKQRWLFWYRVKIKSKLVYFKLKVLSIVTTLRASYLMSHLLPKWTSIYLWFFSAYCFLDCIQVQDSESPVDLPIEETTFWTWVITVILLSLLVFFFQPEWTEAKPHVDNIITDPILMYKLGIQGPMTEHQLSEVNLYLANQALLENLMISPIGDLWVDPWL